MKKPVIAIPPVTSSTARNHESVIVTEEAIV
jgi:hypothetical protein